MCDRLARCPRSLVLLTSAGVGRTQKPASAFREVEPDSALLYCQVGIVPNSLEGLAPLSVFKMYYLPASVV